MAPKVASFHYGRMGRSEWLMSLPPSMPQVWSLWMMRMGCCLFSLQMLAVSAPTLSSLVQPWRYKSNPLPSFLLRHTLSIQSCNPILPDIYKQQLDDYIEGRIYLPHFKKNGIDLPCFCSRPSLLLHQLDAQDISRFESFLEKSTRFSLVYGTSGAGKTRTLYSYLSKNFGLFFVCNELGNGGSSDFREMMQRIKPLMRKDDPSRNASVVTFAVTLLLLARLQIFYYCKSKGITTEGWLVLQAACHYLEGMGRSVDLDVFHLYYKEILEQNIGVFSLHHVDLLHEIVKAQRATANLVAGTEAPIIVVDEAQVICTRHPDYGPFQSDQPDSHTQVYEQRPLAKPVLDSFYNTIQQHRVLFTGTGLTLTFKCHEISTPVAKAVTNDSQYSEFGGWVVAEDMLRYAQNILKIDGCTERIIKEKIFPWFRGRFRPFVTLVEETLIRGEDIGNVWQDMKECLTTACKLPGMQKSLYAQVDALLKNLRGNLHTVTNHEVANLLLRATVQYFYFGRPLDLDEEGEIEVIILEYGIGRVRSEDGRVVIDEPLALLAMHECFENAGLIDKFLRGLMCDINYSCAEGCLWQHVCPLEIEKKWEKYGGVLAKMGLFDMDLPENLKALRNEESQIVEGKLWNGNNPCKIYISTDNYDSWAYLADEEPRCKFHICENQAGCDIMWRVLFLQSKVIVLFTAQLKLRKRLGGKVAVDAAMRKAAPLGGRIEQWKGSVICLLVVYPALRGTLPPIKQQELSHGRSKCTFVVDKENAHMLFSKEHLKTLDHLKGSRDIPEDKCEQCGKTEDASEEPQVRWILCDMCNGWYHSYCVKQQPADKKFICSKCVVNLHGKDS